MVKSTGLTGIITFSMVNIVPKLFEIFPKKPVFLASLPITFIALLIGVKYCFESQKDFNMITAFPDRVEIWNDRGIIAIKDKKTNEVEHRSLSDMRLLRCREPVSPGTFPGPYSTVVERGELVYALNEREVNIFCKDDLDDYGESKKKLHSLQTPSEFLVSLDVSENQNVIAVIDLCGFLRKYELQKSEDMDTIMNTDMDAD